MKKTRICLLATTFAGALGVAVAVGVNLANSDPVRAPFRTPLTQAQTPVDLSTATITRRVYIINTDNYWGEGWTEDNMRDNLYVRAHKTNNSANKDMGAATRLMTDVRKGLFYADIGFAGAGHQITVSLQIGDDETPTYQTVDVALPALNSALSDIVFVNAGLTEGKRNASAGSFGEMSEGNAAYFLGSFKTCSNAYTDGYNAYPQLAKDFYNIPAVDQSTSVSDYDYSVYHEAGDDYAGIAKTTTTTIGAKLAAMRSMYEANGWSVASYAVPLNYGNDPYVVTPLDDGINVTYEGVKDGSWKNLFNSFGVAAPVGAKGITMDIINKTSNAVELSIGFGSGDPFASHLVKKGTYDWFDDGAKRAKLDIGGDGWRNCTFYFEEAATINASILFLDSVRGASEATRTGNLDFRNATYIF